MPIEVIFAVYKRAERIPIILKQLENQTYKDCFNVNIWNNTGKEISVKYKGQVRIFSRGENKGAGDRYRIIPEVSGNPIIIFDDDEDLAPDFVEYNFNEWTRFGKNCLLGWYTKIYEKGEMQYMKEKKMFLPYGSEVDVVGTGGMVVDREFFDKDIRLTDMQYPFVKDDMHYISAMARLMGYKLIAIEPRCKIINDGKNGGKSEKGVRQEVFNIMRNRGWKFLSEL